MNSEKLETLISAIDDFEIARDAIADAISDIDSELGDLPLVKELQGAEPDASVIDTLRDIASRLEQYVSEEGEEEE